MFKIIFLLSLVALTAHAGPPLNWSATGGAFYPSVGQVQMPAGTLAAPGTTSSGDLSSGLFWPTTSNLGFDFGAAELGRMNATGFSLGTTTVGAKLTVVNTAGGDATGLELWSSSGSKWGFSPQGAALFVIPNGISPSITLSNGNNLGFGPNAAVTRYMWEWALLDTSTSPGTDIIPNSGTHNLDVQVMRNASATANNYEGLAFAGSAVDSTSVSAYLVGYNEVHTAGAESGRIGMGTRSGGGALTEGFTLNKDQTLKFGHYGLGIGHLDSSGNLTSSALTTSEIPSLAATYCSLTGCNYSGAITLSADPVSALQPATKQYVDQTASNGVAKGASVYATTAALAANIYNNGASGVGATLTGVSFGALSFDGNTPTVGQRVLIKNEATQANNGIYVVTTVGAVSTLYVLTRATDFNSTTDIVDGATTYITSGATLLTTTWQLQVAGAVTVGTTALVFNQTGSGGVVTATTGYEPEIRHLNGMLSGQYSLQDIDGTTRVEQSKTLQKIIVCASDFSGVGGTVVVKANYGTAKVSNTSVTLTVSASTIGATTCTSASPAASLVTNDQLNADMVSATGSAENLTIKFTF